MDFVAWTRAQSLLTLGASFVWNIVVARCYGEKVGKIELCATLVISIGTIVCVIFADHYTPNYSLEDIRQLYRTSRMLAYILIIPIVTLLHILPVKYIRKHNYLNDPVYKMAAARVECWCYAGTAGIIGAQAILFAKQIMELLKSWSAGEAIWAHWEVYLSFSCQLACLEISVPECGLRLYDALQLYPSQTYWMIVGILGGFALWGELEEMDALSKWMFFLGCLISLVGVVILSTRKTNRGSSAGAAEASNAKSSSTSTRKDFEPSAYSSVTGNDTDDDAIELLSTRSSSSSFDVVDRFHSLVRGQR